MAPDHWLELYRDAVDLDGDGDEDLVWFSAGVRWTENVTGNGPEFDDHPLYGAPALFLGRALLVQDLDRDGDLDVISAASTSSATYPHVILWHENSNGDASAWRTRAIQVPDGPVGTLSAGEVDGDGDVDLMAGLSSSPALPSVVGSYSWYENRLSSGRSWKAHLMDVGIRASHREIHVADVDGDGDVDALFSTTPEATSQPNPVGWLENLAGDGSVWGHHLLGSVGSLGPSRELLAAVELDRDGDTDVLRASPLGLVWSENLDGSGTSWIEETLFLGSPGELCSFADVDADGDRDVLVQRRILGPSSQVRLSWYENETAVTPYGSDVNPPRSLRLLSGTPSIGQALTFGLDSPLDTQASGAWTYLSIATEPEDEFPAGDLPNWGMAGPGAAGELLIAYSGGNPVKIVAGPPWPGPGTPASIAVAVPNDPSLVGRRVYFQGALIDPGASLGVRFGLTNALRVELGP
ncbi:MAG: VCBS repeat-containing protein [Planctomycetes bacterium]|nr:VCBS repeat-containing protein [Planctomycetota bacterium]